MNTVEEGRYFLEEITEERTLENPQFPPIAARFGVRADVLAAAVRRADAVTALRRGGEGNQDALIAARDRIDNEDPAASQETERL